MGRVWYPQSLLRATTRHPRGRATRGHATVPSRAAPGLPRGGLCHWTILACVTLTKVLTLRHVMIPFPLTIVRLTTSFVTCGLLVVIFLMSACSTTNDAGPSVGFQPILLPVKLTATSSGFTITGDRTLVTPLGLVSIGANVRLPEKGEKTIRVTIRDRKRGGVGFDDIYDVEAGYGNFEAVTNGTTRIQVSSDRKVLIDVTDARVESIEFGQVEPATLKEPDDENFLSQWWSRHWSRHWETLPFGYHPWSLTRFMYEDSTIDKWYGIGFVYFLVRLIVAGILAIIEFFIFVALFLAAIFYLFFGETGRNICYGLLSLFLLFILGASVRGWRELRY